MVFRRDLADVEAKIRRENRWVRQQESYVSVVLLGPITRGKNDIISAEGILHQLQGAFVAQRAANRTKQYGGTPYVQLLIANSGSRAQQWQYAVEEIKHRGGSSDRVVAVVELGPSTPELQAGAVALAAYGERNPIPVVGSVITADQVAVSKAGLPTLVRVAPTNSQEGAAAATYAKQALGARTALLIQDVDDLYSKSLATAFVREFADTSHRFVARPESYSSGLDDPDPANLVLNMRPEICGGGGEKPDVVYFAGRSSALEALLDQLGAHPCDNDRPVTILTGDDASNLPAGRMRAGIEEGLVQLRFTSLAHPDMWKPGDGRDPLAMRFTDAETSDSFPALFQGESLDDGLAIMGHDAVLVTVRAIRATHRNVIPANVTQQLSQLHGRSGAVVGASGAISFDQRGNPEDKTMAILQLRGNGSGCFLGLVSPSTSGKQASPSCAD
ncbi:hypothetical protein GCM10027569_73950 [Flindersiella endophytica]